MSKSKAYCPLPYVGGIIIVKLKILKYTVSRCPEKYLVHDFDKLNASYSFLASDVVKML